MKRIYKVSDSGYYQFTDTGKFYGYNKNEVPNHDLNHNWIRIVNRVGICVDNNYIVCCLSEGDLIPEYFLDAERIDLRNATQTFKPFTITTAANIPEDVSFFVVNGKDYSYPSKAIVKITNMEDSLSPAKKCECGSESIGYTTHSTWCPKHE